MAPWAWQGCQVRKGAKAALVIFYKAYETEPDPDDDNDDGVRRVAKASWAFNAEQVEGFSPPPPSIDHGPIDRAAHLDAFIAATHADIRHGGTQAYYRTASDLIQMPDEGLFTGTTTMGRSESYYAVLLHELTHWVGAEKRLNRQFGRFGTDAYAMEEMVAELGAAFLCAELGLTAEPRPDHAHYIGHWMRILKSDTRAIFAAAAKASEAVRALKAYSTPTMGATDA